MTFFHLTLHNLFAVADVVVEHQGPSKHKTSPDQLAKYIISQKKKQKKNTKKCLS